MDSFIHRLTLFYACITLKCDPKLINDFTLTISYYKTVGWSHWFSRQGQTGIILLDVLKVSWIQIKYLSLNIHSEDKLYL